MATDYDAPRKTDDELNEDSLEELKARRADKTASAVDVDEADLAENLELPGADLSNEEFSVRVAAAPGRRVHLLALLPGPPPQPAGQAGQEPAGLQRVRGLSSGRSARGAVHGRVGSARGPVRPRRRRPRRLHPA